LVGGGFVFGVGFGAVVRAMERSVLRRQGDLLVFVPLSTTLSETLQLIEHPPAISLQAGGDSLKHLQPVKS